MSEDRITTSAFNVYVITTEFQDSTYNIRILKMKNSVFIYIGMEGNETLEDIGVAVPTKNDAIVGITVAGPVLCYDSQELAKKLARRLKKQVYISYNIPNAKVVQLFMAETLMKEINLHPDIF